MKYLIPLFAFTFGLRLAATAAVNLSLSSTNDYFFTTPISTNLTGKTFVLDGQGAACLVPRAEDISFLREAFEERYHAFVYWPPVIVPSNTFYSAGIFADDLSIMNFFRPSFGIWGEGVVDIGYAKGFYLKPGVDISTDFRETGPDYLWYGVSTDYTNTVQAFVADSYVFPTNGTDSILPLTNAVLRRRTIFLSNITSAYEFLRKDVRLLYCDHQLDKAYSLAQTTWTERDNKDRQIESFTPAGGIRYSYPMSGGGTGYGTYYSGFTLGDWTHESYRSTNSFPSRITSYLILRERGLSRQYEGKITAWRSARDYDLDVFKIGNDYESYDHFANYFSGEGNLVLDLSNSTDIQPTNALKEVSAIIVARFRVIRRDSYSGTGLATIPPAVSYTNHFVFVDQTACRRRTDGKWDTDLDFIARINEILNGYDFIGWCRAVPLPPITRTPDFGTGVTSYHQRRLQIDFDDVFVYPYIRREWNARVFD